MTHRVYAFLLVLVAVANAVTIESFVTTQEESREPKNLNACEAFLLYQGVYAPDPRFDAFVDGVMVNTIAELKRRKMDPLYFRVYNQGVIEHVSTIKARGKKSMRKNRSKRQATLALGGGVIRGLTSVQRFGSAEMQLAGNITLVRSHWLMGPLFLIIDYRGDPSITRVRTELQAVQFDTLTSIDKFGAEMRELKLNSPLFDFMAYFGNRTLSQQKTTELVVKQIFSNSAFMVTFLKEAFEVASYDKIIPQFGADDNYYSVLQYLFNGKQDGRAARITLLEYQEVLKEQLLKNQQLKLEAESSQTDNLT